MRYRYNPYCACPRCRAHGYMGPAVLITLGVLFLLSEITATYWLNFDRTWPALKREGMFRTPRAGVEFGDVVLTWYANQGEQPLVSSQGQLQDHIGLRVADLDAWVAKLRSEGVTLLAEPYRLGDTRAVMIEGPSREALELVEVR